MRYKALEQNAIFYHLPKEVENNLGCNYEIKLLTKIPNITKTDILEFCEYMIFVNIECNMEIDVELLGFAEKINYWDNLESLKPSYCDDYIAIMGQLFLSGYIDFYRSMCEYGIEDNTPNLSQYKPDNQYKIWIYFRDNFIYRQLYRLDLTDINPKMQDDFWANPKNWSGDHINCMLTPKGTKYYNEILAPRFYNKYKDLEVEIDKKGNIIRWIGEINR